LNDEFTSATTTANWTNLFPARHSVLDIATSLPGWLTLVPVGQNFNGWYSEYQGPLFFKTITGNFVVETSVVIGSATDRTAVPTLSNSFVQAGFVIRDPSSQAFRQRWIMYNLGFQDVAVAREIKTTVPSSNLTTDSLSTLYLNDITGGLNRGRLRVCRIGTLFRFFHQHPPSTTWTEEVFRSTTAPTRVNGNGPRPARADGSVLSFDRPDMAATVQVGLYGGNYLPPAAGVRAEFDHFRVGTVLTGADCVQPL
jgi:hypothetical protein